MINIKFVYTYSGSQILRLCFINCVQHKTKSYLLSDTHAHSTLRKRLKPTVITASCAVLNGQLYEHKVTKSHGFCSLYVSLFCCTKVMNADVFLFKSCLMRFCRRHSRTLPYYTLCVRLLKNKTRKRILHDLPRNKMSIYRVYVEGGRSAAGYERQ